MLNDRPIAMVPTLALRKLEAKALLKALRPLLPKGAQVPRLIEGEEEGSNVVVGFGNVSVAVVAMPIAIPEETLSQAFQYEYIWKGAQAAFGECKAHFLLSVIEPGSDPRDALAHAQALTIVTAAVVRAFKGRGVYFAQADCVIAPERFLEEAKSVGTSAFASALWFAFRFFPGSDDPESDAIICQSTGLRHFLGREIEIGPYELEPFDIAQRTMAAARYMASEGPIFAEGHTLSFGDKDTGRARIFFDWSRLGGEEIPVFHLRILELEDRA